MAFPTRLLSKMETRTSLAWFNWNLSLRGIFETICGGTTMVFVAFALSIGVPKNMMGYFSAAISVACVVQLLCLPLVSRVRNRKRFILTAASIEPLLLIFAVAITPFLPIALRSISLGIAVFLAAACLHLTRPFSEDWLATTIPSGLRGRYIGRRIRLSSLAIIAATLVVGYVVNIIGTENSVGLAILMIVGAGFGVAAALTLTRATMPVSNQSAQFDISSMREVLGTKPFMRLLMALVLFNLPFFLGVAYYHVFNLEVLKMSPWLISCMGVGYLLVKLFATPWFGKMCDRTGARKMLWATGPIYVVFFLCFSLAEPGRMWPMALAWAFVALADGIYVVAITAVLYGSIPEQGLRPAYFALYNLVILGSFAIGGVLAVPLLPLLQQIDWSWSVFNLRGYHLFYAIMGVLMIPCATAVALIPDFRGKSKRPPPKGDSLTGGS